MESEVQPLTPGAKVQAVLVLSLLGATFVSVICFYATSQKDFFFRTLQVLIGLEAILSAFDTIRRLVALARKTSRDREAIGIESSNLMYVAIFVALTVISFVEFVPRWHFPWLLLVVFLTSAIIVTIAHDILKESETIAILRFFLFALLSIGLTIGQIALVEYFDTWLFVMTRVIPIPLLGITVVISGIAGVFCIVLTAYAIAFHTLRLAFSVK